MKKPVKKTANPETPVPAILKPGIQKYRLFFLLSVAIIFYFNTIFNEYALDDFLVISKNSFTQQGIRGIPDLLTKTSYFGFFKHNNEEVTLRYRPVVMISYALECEFFKNKRTLLIVSHMVNVLIFLLTVYILLRLFDSFFFKQSKHLAFLAVLLFAVHPIHTEAVANLKGRDELLSMLFVILSAWFLFKYNSEKKPEAWILSLLFFSCGLLSKENTVSFLIIFPLMLHFFTPLKWKKIMYLMLPFIILTIGYIMLRFSITGWSHTPTQTILNNPFLNSGVFEKYATIIYCLGFYLKLLFFPHPLSYDYTYNQIRLVQFDNPMVWVSLGIHLAMLIYAIYGLRQKSIVAFGILFYFISIFLVTNIPVNLGALIGERLLYTPSLGFCIIMAYILTKFFNSVSVRTGTPPLHVQSIFLFLLIIVSGYKTIGRNAVWKNNFTLMTHDAASGSESMKANDAAAIAYILATDDPTLDPEKKKQFLAKAILHDHKAAEIMPSFTDIYFNLGASFSRLEMTDSAEFYWNIARKQKPHDTKIKEYDEILSIMFLKRGLKKAVEKDIEGCFQDLSKSVFYNPKQVDAWYNYGGALFSVGRFEEAKHAFRKVLEIDPSHQEARHGLNSILSSGY